MTKITDEERIGSRVAADIFGYTPLKHKLNEQEQAELHGWVQQLVTSETEIFVHRHRWRGVMHHPISFLMGGLTGVLVSIVLVTTMFWGVDIKESNRLALEANKIEERRAATLERLLDSLDNGVCEINEGDQT